ncbi:MAG: hypothetical protein ACFCGT_18440 [Sandaracinaceae bacterium]
MTGSPPPRHEPALTELLGKYAEMVALREADEAGEGADPKPAMRELASRFPGALREIDELPLGVLRGRSGSLRRFLDGAEEEPDWARPMAAYHGWLRVALGVKRAAGPSRRLEAATAWLAGPYRPLPGDPPAAELTEAALAAMLRPPGGRLNGWVLERVAARYGITRDTLERRLFPPSPMRRQATEPRSR